MARQRPFCTLSRFKLLQVDQGSSVPLAKCSFGMIALSRHSVDRSPRAFHSSTYNVVRASCFEVVSASVESRKLFLDGSLCLAGRWPWSGCLGSSSWRQRSALLATFRRMWGGAIILHVSFRAISTCPVCLERPHEEHIQLTKSKAPGYKAETSTSCIPGNFILKANSATTSDTTSTLLVITE